MILDRTSIYRGQSKRGGWSRMQIELIGGKWPLKHGWMNGLVGTFVSDRDYDLFVSLKNAHLEPPSELAYSRDVDAHLPDWLKGAGLDPPPETGRGG